MKRKKHPNTSAPAPAPAPSPAPAPAPASAPLPKSPSSQPPEVIANPLHSASPKQAPHEFREAINQFLDGTIKESELDEILKELEKTVSPQRSKELNTMFFDALHLKNKQEGEKLNRFYDEKAMSVKKESKFIIAKRLIELAVGQFNNNEITKKEFEENVEEQLKILNPATKENAGFESLAEKYYTEAMNMVKNKPAFVFSPRFISFEKSEIL